MQAPKKTIIEKVEPYFGIPATVGGFAATFEGIALSNPIIAGVSAGVAGLGLLATHEYLHAKEIRKKALEDEVL